MKSKSGIYKFLLWAIVCSFFFINLSGIAHSETIVDSHIVADTTWTIAGSPYIVTIQLDVYPDVTLTIEPGVVVKFNSGTDLEIYGELIAVGTPTQLVVFTSSQETPSGGDWGGISYKEGAVGTVEDGNGNYVSGSKFAYCEIHYGGGLQSSVSLHILSNKVLNNSSGIISYDNSKIESNILENNGSQNGIDNSGNSRIVNNTISNHGRGIYNTGLSFIDHNIIKNNGTIGYGGGIYSISESITITYNIIEDNSGFGNGGGIYCESEECTITHNTITGNKVSGNTRVIAYAGGMWVDCNNFIISNNTIMNNSGGGHVIRTYSHDLGMGKKLVSNNLIKDNIGRCILDSSSSQSSPLRFINNICDSNGYENAIIKKHDRGNIHASSIEMIGNTIKNNHGNGVFVRGEWPIIEKNYIYRNSGVGISNDRAHAVIRNNEIYENLLGGVYIYSVVSTISNNLIINNSGNGIEWVPRGSNSGPGIITNNVIKNNSGSGIITTSPFSATIALQIMNNIVSGNCSSGGVGIKNYGFSIINFNEISNNYCTGIETSILNEFTGNNIYNNTTFDFYYTGTTDQIAINNYWGTTNRSEIMSNIYDYWDDITLGKVIFEPFATEPFVFSPIAEEIIGTWSSGIWYWDEAASEWAKMSSGMPSGDITAGDFTGDGKADVASIWDSGLWYQDGATLDWTKVSGPGAVYLTAGDVTGDGQAEIIGTWSSGIWYWDEAASEWTKMSSGMPSGDITAGDFTGDGKADVASIWDSGLWYQDGATLDWTKVSGPGAVYLTAGDVTGDGQAEIIGTWSSGIRYWDEAASEWAKMSSGMPSGDITAGDFTGDGKADVASCWDSGLWYQDGATLDWTKVSNTAPTQVTAGDVTGD